MGGIDGLWWAAVEIYSVVGIAAQKTTSKFVSANKVGDTGIRYAPAGIDGRAYQ